MPLREVAPLGEEQWEILMKLMKRGPTEKQKKFIKESLEKVERYGWNAPE